MKRIVFAALALTFTLDSAAQEVDSLPKKRLGQVADIGGWHHVEARGQEGLPGGSACDQPHR